MDFSEALAKATELGYAEADPTADVEGLDAGRKVAILASIAFHSRVVFDDVYTEGITKISAKDVAYAKEFGSVIKLLGVAHNREDGIEVAVYPMMLPKNHPLASVRDSILRRFLYNGDALDDAMFYRKRRRRASNSQCCYGRCDRHYPRYPVLMYRTNQLYLLQEYTGQEFR